MTEQDLDFPRIAATLCGSCIHGASGDCTIQQALLNKTMPDAVIMRPVDGGFTASCYYQSLTPPDTL